MRVLSFALAFFAADVVVEAGVCKPARTTASQSVLTSSVESSATAVSTAVTEASVVSAESLTSATETMISASSIETLTASITLAGTTSTELVSSGTTEEVSTATTEETPTTTTANVGPYMTPGSIVGTGPVADLTLYGDGTKFLPLSFGPSESTETLIFTLVDNKLYLGGSSYLCVTNRAEGVLGPLVLCSTDTFSSTPLVCEREPNGTLACTSPATYCLPAYCRRPNVATPFSQFYVDNGQTGYFGPPGDFAGFAALDLILAQ